ncbi:hypothetical protein [Acinetobacter gandensis]
MMKKTGLLLLAVMGVAGLAVGCSSQEAVESPETAQHEPYRVCRRLFYLS